MASDAKANTNNGKPRPSLGSCTLEGNEWRLSFQNAMVTMSTNSQNMVPAARTGEIFSGVSHLLNFDEFGGIFNVHELANE